MEKCEYGLDIEGLTLDLGNFRLDNITLKVPRGCITGAYRPQRRGRLSSCFGFFIQHGLCTLIYKPYGKGGKTAGYNSGVCRVGGAVCRHLHLRQPFKWFALCRRRHIRCGGPHSARLGVCRSVRGIRHNADHGGRHTVRKALKA